MAPSNQSFLRLGLLATALVACTTPTEISDLSQEIGRPIGSPDAHVPPPPPDTGPPVDGPPECLEAIACPVIDEPPTPEYIRCEDLVAGWVFQPGDYPDQIRGAGGYTIAEVQANQPNDWFTPVPPDPTNTCCTPGEIQYSYTKAGEIACNPPWVIPDGFNEAAVVFSIYVDSSSVCGQCNAFAFPIRPPIIAMNMNRPGGPVPPQQQNKPVPVPPGTKPLLPNKKIVPATDPVAPTETKTPKAALPGIVSRPALDRKPIDGKSLGITNQDYDLSGHQIEATFYSGNREVVHNGKPNWQFNREAAETHADTNTNLTAKKVSLNIQHTKQYDELHRVDTANRVLPAGPTKVEIGGKLYTMSGLTPDENRDYWQKLSTSYTKTFGNYVDRAQKPGVAKCWLEGASKEAVFAKAEWPELVKLWEQKFTAGLHAGQRKVAIEYFQGGKWHTYDGTNPPNLN